MKPVFKFFVWVFFASLIIQQSNSCLASRKNEPALQPQEDKTSSLQFNPQIEKRLFEHSEFLTKRLEEEFLESADALNKYSMDFTKPLDVVLANFEDFIGDTASNYYFKMSQLIKSSTLGIGKIRIEFCPSLSSIDPLAALTTTIKECIIKQKEEIALQRAINTLNLIAYAYSNAIRNLGFKLIDESGLLSKLIALKSQALIPGTLPSLVVEDTAWRERFKEAQPSFFLSLKDSFLENLKGVSKSIWNDFKSEVKDLAGQELDIYLKKLKGPDSPLIKEINTYKFKVQEIKTKILDALKEVQNSLDIQLATLTQQAQLATQSFISFLQSTLDRQSEKIIFEPLSAGQETLEQSISSLFNKSSTTLDSVLTRVDTLFEDKAKILLSNIENSKNIFNDLMKKAINSVREPIETLKAQLQNQMSEALDDLRSTAISLQTDQSSEEASIADELQQEVNALATDIEDLLSLFLSLLQDIASAFDQKVQDKLTAIFDQLTKLSTSNPLSATSNALKSRIKDSLQQLNEQLMIPISLASSYIDQLHNLISSNLSGNAAEIQALIDVNVNNLNLLQTSVRSLIFDYINQKVTFLTTTLDDIDQKITKLQNIDGRDFLDLAESFVADPQKTIDKLKSSFTCKEKDASDTCKLTYTSYLSNQLKISTLTSEISSLYQAIAQSLNTFIADFEEEMKSFAQSQKTKLNTSYAQLLTSENGTSIIDTIKAIPQTAEANLSELQNDISRIADDSLSSLQSLKNSLRQIQEIFNDTTPFNELKASLDEKKNQIIRRLSTLPGKVNAAIKKAVQHGNKLLEEKLKTLLPSLDNFSSLISEISDTDFSSFLIDTNNTNFDLSGIVDAITSFVTSIPKDLSSLLDPLKISVDTIKTAPDTIIKMITSLPDILKNSLFKGIPEIISKLNLESLELITQGKALAENLTSIQSHLQSLVEQYSIQKPKINLQGQIITITLASESDAQKLAKAIETAQNKLFDLFVINQKGSSLIIEPHFITLTKSKFKELLDEIQELIVSRFMNAIRTFTL